MFIAILAAVSLLTQQLPPPPPPPVTEELAPPPAPVTDAPPPVRGTGPAPVQRFVMRDGQQYIGRRVAADADRISVRIADEDPTHPKDSVVVLSYADVRMITGVDLDQLQRENVQAAGHRADATRYFYFGSAYLLPRGVGIFSQDELVLSRASYGIHDRVTISAGTALPMWLTGSGLNAMIGVKGGWTLAEDWRVAVGADVAYLLGAQEFRNVMLLLPYATVTFGAPRAQLSLTVTQAIPGAANDQFTGLLPNSGPLVVASGAYALNEGWTVITENWLGVRLSRFDGGVSFLSSVGFRYGWPRVSIDLAVALSPELPTFVMPWFDVSYRWGAP